MFMHNNDFSCRRIMVMPRFSTASNGEKMKSLGLFLQCTPEGEGTSWSCQASARITVLNQKVPEESFARSKIQVFVVILIQLSY